MGEKIRNLMTTDLVTLDANAPVAEAARRMREANVGDVLVTNQGKLAGIVTDRDIVVRCLADGGDPQSTPLERICSKELTTLSPEDDSDKAVRLMQDQAIRRIPVVENGQVRGIVSIGDLAQQRDPRSALGQISQAPANR